MHLRVNEGYRIAVATREVGNRVEGGPLQGLSCLVTLQREERAQEVILGEWDEGTASEISCVSIVTIRAVLTHIVVEVAVFPLKHHPPVRCVCECSGQQNLIVHRVRARQYGAEKGIGFRNRVMVDSRDRSSVVSATVGTKRRRRRRRM